MPEQHIFPNKGNNKINIVAGRNVYEDKNGNPVLYDPHTHTGYIIRPKDAAGFSAYRDRFFIALATGVLAASFTSNYVLPLASGLLVYGVLEYRYRKVYLPSLPHIENFKPRQKRTLQKALTETGNPSRCFLLAALYTAFGILLPIYEFQQHASLLLLSISLLVTAICFYMAFNHLAAAMHIKR